MQGYVKWFDIARGYGFLTGQDNQDYFAHYSAIEGRGYKSLTKGEEVGFEIEKDEQGRYRAANIQKLEVI